MRVVQRRVQCMQIAQFAVRQYRMPGMNARWMLLYCMSCSGPGLYQTALYDSAAQSLVLLPIWLRMTRESVRLPTTSRKLYCNLPMAQSWDKRMVESVERRSKTSSRVVNVNLYHCFSRGNSSCCARLHAPRMCTCHWRSDKPQCNRFKIPDCSMSGWAKTPAITSRRVCTGPPGSCQVPLLPASGRARGAVPLPVNTAILRHSGRAAGAARAARDPGAGGTARGSCWLFAAWGRQDPPPSRGNESNAVVWTAINLGAGRKTGLVVTRTWLAMGPRRGVRRRLTL